MNDDIGDEFARWWWPGQWLRIVYGVWIDPLWYWQHVRPRLRGRTKGWGIWVQGMLGAALTAFALVAFVGAASSISGMQVKWQFLFPSVAIGIAVGIVLGMLIVVQGVADSMAIGIVTSICFGAMFGVSAGLSGTRDMILGTAQSLTILSFVGPVLMSVSLGVGRVVIEVRKCSVLEALFIVMMMLGVFFSFSQMPKVAVAIAAAVASGCGIYASGRWATRQIPDEETRRRLANPE